MFKRIISLFLVFILLTGMLPVQVFAQDGTGPVATEPPATEPPATEPPATEPPATEPPATEPPATEPPATEPPVTEPPVTEPEETEPEETEPVPFDQSVALSDGYTASMAADAGVFPEGATMCAERNSGDAAQTVLKNTVTALETAAVFDLSVVDAEGNAIQPQGSVTVTLSVGDFLNNLNGRIVSVYYVNISNGTVSQIGAQIDAANGTVTFVTDHFSTYAVAIRQAPIKAPSPKAPTLEEVVALYEALPEPDSITAKTTEEEKDTIFAQLEEAVAAYNKLGSDDMDTFDSAYFHLLIKEQELNEALIADYSEILDEEGVPVYIFLVAPNQKATADSNNYFDHPDYTQGQLNANPGAEDVIPYAGFRDINDERVVTQYVSGLDAFKSFTSFSNSYGSFNNEEYDIVWIAISKKEGQSNTWWAADEDDCYCPGGRFTHIHIDGQLTKRITPAAINLTKTLPRAQSVDETFTFTMIRLEQDSGGNPTEVQDTGFAPLTLSATVKAGETSAAISGTSGTFNFGYYKIHETSSKKWHSDPVYLQVATDGTLKYSKSLSSGWTTSTATRPVTIDNEYQTYTVNYSDGVNGAVFADQGTSGLYYEADTPAFNGTPTRDGYNFIGWSPEVTDKVLDDVTYVAQWELKQGSIKVEKTFAGIDAQNLPANSFQITVASSDGSETTLTLADADSPQSGLTYTWTLNDLPVKDTYTVLETGYETTGYDFIAGSSTTSRYNIRVEENRQTLVQLRNVYEPVEYTIIWVNDDGTKLDEEQVAYGITPVYTGETPKSAKLSDGDITFTGWTPEVVPVTGDATYTATYSQSFTVTYVDYDGTQLLSQSVPSGEATPECDPAAPEGWKFLGWSPAVAPRVTEDATYTASWEVPYTVEHYLQAAGQYPATATVTETFTGHAGQTVTAQYHDQEGYKADTTALGTLTSAKLDKTGVVLKLYYKQQFTVLWKDSFNQSHIYETDSGIDYGTQASCDSAKPSRSQDGQYSYSFDGYWSEKADGTGKLYKQVGTALYEVTQQAGENQSEELSDTALAVSGDMTLYARYTPHELHHTGTIQVLLNAGYNTAQHVAVGGEPIDIEAATGKAGIENVQGLALFREGDSTKTPHDLIRTGVGIYRNEDLLDGIYHLHYKYADGTYSTAPISTQQLDIQGQDRTRYLFFYSVNYKDGNDLLWEEYYRTGAAVNVSETIPAKAGYVFSHWVDEDGNIFNPSTAMAATQLTSGISEEHTLTAVWKVAAVLRVKVNLVHGGHEGSEPLHITLTKRPTENGEYAEVIGATYKEDPTGIWTETEYLHTFSDIPVDKDELGNYSAHATLSGYKRVANNDGSIPTPEPTYTGEKDENGNEIYEIVLNLEYSPDVFDLEFTVTIDSSVGQTNPKLVPKAVDVKVTRWDSDEGKWLPIRRHDTSSMQVQIDSAYTGTGIIQVAGYKDNKEENRYLYRIEVVGIDFNDSSYYMAMDDSTETAYVTYHSEEKGFFPEGAYVGQVTVTGGASAGNLNGVHARGEVDTGLIQVGTVNAHIKLNPYTVVLDPNGGTFPAGTPSVTAGKVTFVDRFTVPALDSYTPTQTGKTFLGWYVEDAAGALTEVKAGSDNYTIKDLLPADAALGSTLTLGAKWSENITVTGQVAVANYYAHDGHDRTLLAHDWLNTVTVLLQRLQGNGYTDTEKSQTVTLTYEAGAAVGTADFTFSNLPSNETYRVAIISPNFNDKYQNEPDSLEETKRTAYETAYTEDDYVALTDGDDTAVVNIFMKFQPSEFSMAYKVDATAIAEPFQPLNAEIQVVCDDNAGHSGYATWPVITQHSPNGEKLILSGGIGSGSEQVWHKHTTGYSYNYAIRLSDYQLPGVEVAVAYGEDAPFTVSYINVPVTGTSYDPNEPPTAVLTPKQYPIYYDADGNGTLESRDPRNHTWGIETQVAPLTDAPDDGKVFLGWYDNAQHTGDPITVIEASHHAVTHLYAWWEPDANNDGDADIYQKTVTFKVVNGKWNNGTTADKTIAVTLHKDGVPSADGIGTLNAESIPAAGSNPNEKFKAAETPDLPWNPNVGSLTITGDVSYTYTYDPIHYDRIDPSGGKWVNGTETYTQAVELPVGSYGDKADPTRDGYVFDGWDMESVENDTHLKTIYTAQWLEDADNNGIADSCQKTVIFQVENGTWADGTAEPITKAYELRKDGEAAPDGTADISADVPEDMKPAQGWLETGAAWVPLLPEDGIVSGTDTVIFVFRFTAIDYRDVHYQPVDTNTDDDLIPTMLTDQIQAYKFIQVQPNGGYWRGSSLAQDLQLIQDVTLEAPTRAQHVFIGWKKTAGGTPAGNVAKTIEYTYTAQWIHQDRLKYPVTVETWLDGAATDIQSIHDAHSEIVLKNTDGTGSYVPLTGNSTNPGVYTGKLLPGTYEVYFGQDHRMDDYLLSVVANPAEDQNKLVIRHYSVNYWNQQPEGAADTWGEPDHREIYHINSPVTVISDLPRQDGYEFLGWKLLDGGDTLYAPEAELASRITRKLDLVAQWSKNMDVDVHITINHSNDTNLDETNYKDDVTFTLMKVESSVNRALGEPITLSWDALTNNFTVQKQPSGAENNDVTQTVYAPATDAHTFTDLSRGIYTVNVSKSHYTATVTPGELDEATNTQTIHVVLNYAPDSYDLTFKVKMAEGIPAERHPKAVNVRVQFWNEYYFQDIAQFEGNAAPNQVTLTGGAGTGTHSVWKHIHDPDTPVEYSIRVSSFVYSDGSVVPAELRNGAYTDGNFSATVAVDGLDTGYLGAYFGASGQVGVPTATVTVEKYDIYFDANKGTTSTLKLTDRYDVPTDLQTNAVYIPTRENFTFLGWYVGSVDAGGNVTMTGEKVKPGHILTGDLHLIAAWAPIRTVWGEIYVNGSYEGTSIHEQDRVRNIVVNLQRLQTNTQNGATQAVSVGSVTVPVQWNGNLGTAAYRFDSLEADRRYQIRVDVTNYAASYENEDPAASGYRKDGNEAIYQNDEDIEAMVNARLEFEPDSYTQTCVVDATQIGEGFRPGKAHVVIEGALGNENDFSPIAQHMVAPFGLPIVMSASADTYCGSATERIWKYHWSNTLYRYRMEVTEVDGKSPLTSDPYTILYGQERSFDGVGQSGDLTATLVPKTFDVIFDYNVSGREDYVAANAHTWSHTTRISDIQPADPTRTNFVFMGWVDASGNPVTEIPAATAHEIRVYAKWAEDILSDEDLDPTPNLPGDGIPDEYQCIITYRILGGQWGKNAGSLDKQKVFTLKVKNDEGIWEDRNPTLGDSIPVGMIQDDGQAGNGIWKPFVGQNQQQISADTPVTGSAVYTYVFGTSVTVIVENGTAWFGEKTGDGVHSITNGTHTHSLGGTDSEGSTTIFFEAQPGYFFKSIVVHHDGAAVVDPALTDGTYRVENKDNTMIHVVYGPDVNRDEVLDEYQKKVNYHIENGTWDGNAMGDIVEYVTLLDGDTPSAEGSGSLSRMPDISKAAPINDKFKGGAWVVAPPQNGIVSGADPVTYTFRFEPKRYVTYTYAIEHYTENLDGTFTLMAEDTQTGSITIELNLAGDGFEEGASGTIEPVVKEYPHFLFNEEESAQSHPLVFGMAENHVLKMYYNRDQHRLTYDLNGGEIPEGREDAYYDPETQLCGTEVTLKDAPVRRGYTFTAWKLSRVQEEGIQAAAEQETGDPSIFQPGSKLPLLDDVKATAQWTANSCEYEVEYYFDGELEESKTVSATAPFDTAITLSDGTETGIAKVISVGQTQYPVEQTAALEENTYVLKDVNLSGDKIAEADNVIKVYYLLDNWGEGGEPDGQPDEEQVRILVVVNPTEAGTIQGEREQILTPSNGQVELSDIAVVANPGWQLRNWTIQEQASSAARSNSEPAVIGTGVTLTDQSVSADAGKTYVVSANMDRLSTPVTPKAAAYLVEHYKKDAASSSYVLHETQILTGELGEEVTAQPENYTGFTLNPLAPGHTPKGTITMPRTENGEIVNMLKLKLYYDPDTGDGVPDMYQKTVVFSIVNGKWADGTSQNISITLTLTDKDGNWSADGTAYLAPYIPVGMTANAGYTRNGWDKEPPSTVSGTTTAVYTYYCVYTKLLATPKTGDASGIELWITMLVLSAAGVVTLLASSKQRRKTR